MNHDLEVMVSLARREPFLIVQLSERQNHRCCYCGLPILLPNENHNHANMATIEHVVPQAHSGSDEESNLVAACRRCNRLRRTIYPPFFIEALNIIFTRQPTAKKMWHIDEFEHTELWQSIRRGMKQLQRKCNQRPPRPIIF